MFPEKTFKLLHKLFFFRSSTGNVQEHSAGGRQLQHTRMQGENRSGSEEVGSPPLQRGSSPPSQVC